jgi:hypothetical protein
VDARATNLGVGRELLGGARLADPRVSRQEEEPALSVERLLEQRPHLLELVLAADEHTAGE